MRVLAAAGVVIVVAAGVLGQAWVLGHGTPPPAVPALDEVASARINLYPMQSAYPASLAPTDTSGRATLTRLLSWIAGASPAAGRTDGPELVLEHERSLSIELAGGGRIDIAQALDCDVDRHGGSVCWLHPSDVLYRTNAANSRPGDWQRLRSPQFAAWLESGWESDMPRVAGKNMP